MADLSHAKAAMNKRLHTERRKKEFEQVRESLKHGSPGVPPISDRIAWQIAVQYFPPLDGSSVEVPCPTGYEAPVMPRPVVLEEFEKQPESVVVASNSTVEKNSVEQVKVTDTIPPVAASLKPPPATNSGKAFNYPAPTISNPASSKLPEAFQKLADAIPVTTKANAKDIIEWAFDNYASDISKIEPSSVPSAGAIGLLHWARLSPSNYSELISIWGKTIPSAAQMKGQGKFTDDGRTDLRLLDDFEATLQGIVQ